MSGEMAIAAALLLPLLICAGIWLAGRVPDLREGVVLATASIDSGAAARKVTGLARITSAAKEAAQ